MMIRIICTISLCLLFIQVQAQDFKISFKSTNPQYSLDSVGIRNITQGTSRTLPETGILQIDKSTEVTYHDYSDRLLLYPNPVTETSFIEFFNKKQGTVRIELYDVTGRLILSQANVWPQGVQTYELSNLNKGIYFLHIQTPSGNLSGKIISMESGGISPHLVATGNERNLAPSAQLKSTNTSLYPMQFNEGDRMHFIGRAGDRTNIFTWTPNKDSIFEFDFVPCHDADGNHYSTVRIGDQLWMAENLKTTKYMDGTLIDYFETNIAEDYKGEYGWYNDDESLKDAYGALYSWYAVDNSNQLCPIGWHVPSEKEWFQMEMHICTQLGNKDCKSEFSVVGDDYHYKHKLGTNEGLALKSCRQISLGGKCSTTEHPRWETEHYESGTNIFGFSALPGGERWGSTYSWLGGTGSWWTSSFREGHSIKHTLYLDNSNVYRDASTNPLVGLSVRCIRDIGKPTMFNLNYIIAPEKAGLANGSGLFEMGSKVTLTAIPEKGYKFVGWILNGKILSTDANYNYTMPDKNVSLIAGFEPEHIDHQPGEGVTDIDGNFYHSVIIGEQEWLTENLKTTRYRNGIPIEFPGNDKTAWSTNTNGAYTWNQNDTIWKDSYGALYNGYAIINGNGLCPTGWSVPDHDQWRELALYVSENGFKVKDMFDPFGIGTGLKSCRQVLALSGDSCDTSEHPRWDADPVHYGVDAFGFSALPAGRRQGDGTYILPGSGGYFWSLPGMYFYISAHYSFIMPFDDYMKAGVSVRCVRNYNPQDANTDSE
jgi:uncharacterized protein (TIGR02145 family)